MYWVFFFNDSRFCYNKVRYWFPFLQKLIINWRFLNKQYFKLTWSRKWSLKKHLCMCRTLLTINPEILARLPYSNCKTVFQEISCWPCILLGFICNPPLHFNIFARIMSHLHYCSWYILNKSDLFLFATLLLFSINNCVSCL